MKAVFWRSADDDVLGLAAEVAFFGLFSLFPFLIFLGSLIPYLPGKDRIGPSLLDAAEGTVGRSSPLFRSIQEYVVAQVQEENRALLSVGLLLSLWGASRGFAILVKGLNRAYEVDERRPWYERRLLGLIIAIGVGFSIPLGILLIVLGPSLLEVVFEGLGLPALPRLIWLLLRWPLVLSLLIAGLALVYYFAPANRQSWRWLTPGSTFGVVAMVVLSLGLTWFIDQDIYQVRWLTYGALGTVVVTLVWMYLMSLAVLVGGELNAVLDKNRQRGTSGTARRQW